MTTDFDSSCRPLRIHWEQRAVALLAGLAAVTVQLGWLEVARPKNTQTWPADAWLLTVVTAYLISLAWFHATTAHKRETLLALLPGQLGRGLFYDSMIAVEAVVALARGASSGVLLAGLWIVPPTLLAASSLSAAVSALAWIQVRNRPLKPVRATAKGLPRLPSDWGRSVISAALLLSLLVIELSEPPLRSRDSLNQERSRQSTPLDRIRADDNGRAMPAGSAPTSSAISAAPADLRSR